MYLKDFDFDLPEELVANQPVFPRDSSRLLTIKNGEFQDKQFTDIVDFLNDGDVLVLNDTKVIPARLFGKRSDAKVQVTLHERKDDKSWYGFAKPARKLKEGTRFDIADDFYAIVKEKNEGEVLLEFNVVGEDLFDKIEYYGKMPLPPYMKREEEQSDKETYQTIYAANKGAVAAPTAGLHFTDELLAKIEAKGVKIVYITLHVGAGTFLPIKVDNVKDHKMHSETFIIGAEQAKTINAAKDAGNKIVSVGTTCLRALESVVDGNGKVKEYMGSTDIFITPGYKFKIIDVLITNFHLPKSTLFMLVSAFCGLNVMQQAYLHAVEHKYRFYSYGDACICFK